MPPGTSALPAAPASNEPPAARVSTAFTHHGQFKYAGLPAEGVCDLSWPRTPSQQVGRCGIGRTATGLRASRSVIGCADTPRTRTKDQVVIGPAPGIRSQRRNCSGILAKSRGWPRRDPRLKWPRFSVWAAGGRTRTADLRVTKMALGRGTKRWRRRLYVRPGHG